jgi:hypothetical protein
MFVPTNSLMLMRKFEAAKPLSCSSASGIWFTLGLAHLFVAVARNDFGLLLIELGVAKFARVAYRNILDRVCRSKLCRAVPRWNFLDLLSFNISYGSACHGGRYEPDTSVVGWGWL